MTEVTNLCFKCFKIKPISEFDIEETFVDSGNFKLGMAEHTVYVRSFTCRECGTTKRIDWINEWKQNS